jgi:hypothetical protein
MVGNFCSVFHCENNSEKRPDLSFYSCPKDQRLSKKWRRFCGRTVKFFRSLKRPRICGLHFEEGDAKISLFKAKLNLPTIFHLKEAISICKASELVKTQSKEMSQSEGIVNTVRH